MVVQILTGIISFSLLIIPFVLIPVLLFRRGRPAPQREIVRAPRREIVRSKEEGNYGERAVAKLLKRCALEGDKIVSNLIVTNPETGMTAEIDHILLSTRGFFVIEVKDYSGTLYGEENEKTWRQVMGRRRMVVNTFYSPFKQNETHIFVLKQVLRTRVYMESVVVFVQGNTANINCKNIYTLNELENHLEQIKAVHLSEKKRDELYDALVKLQEQAVSKEDHILNIYEQQRRIEQNICPRCGKQLVLRKGPYGDFYGCTGYPNCTFKKQVPKE